MRDRRHPVAVALVGIAVVGALGGLISRGRTLAARAESERLDAEAIDRAADEGMDGPTPGIAAPPPGAGLGAEGARPTTGLTTPGLRAEPINWDPEEVLTPRR
jgi:hypothetical protein